MKSTKSMKDSKSQSNSIKILSSDTAQRQAVISICELHLARKSKNFNVQNAKHGSVSIVGRCGTVKTSLVKKIWINNWLGGPKKTKVTSLSVPCVALELRKTRDAITWLALSANMSFVGPVEPVQQMQRITLELSEGVELKWWTRMWSQVIIS